MGIALHLRRASERDKHYMVNVAQLVRASDCGSEGRGLKSHLSPETFFLHPPVSSLSEELSFGRISFLSAR